MEKQRAMGIAGAIYCTAQAALSKINKELGEQILHIRASPTGDPVLADCFKRIQEKLANDVGTCLNHGIRFAAAKFNETAHSRREAMLKKIGLVGNMQEVVKDTHPEYLSEMFGNSADMAKTLQVQSSNMQKYAEAAKNLRQQQAPRNQQHHSPGARNSNFSPRGTQDTPRSKQNHKNRRQKCKRGGQQGRDSNKKEHRDSQP